MRISGETLRLWRTMKKLNQAGVAKKLKVSQQDYSKWESKVCVSEACLNRFVSVMGCTSKELQDLQKFTDASSH